MSRVALFRVTLQFKDRPMYEEVQKDRRKIGILNSLNDHVLLAPELNGSKNEKTYYCRVHHL